MKVGIKNLAVSMDVKNNGVELEVYDNNKLFLGDLVVTKVKLVWCPGKTTVENGISITWKEFIALMNKTKMK